MRLAVVLGACLPVCGAAFADPTLQTVGEVVRAVEACWQMPADLRTSEHLEVTVRFSLRADGNLIGTPRITYVAAAADQPIRDRLARSVLQALEACAPLPLSVGLGRAIAGRVFAVRFIHRGPQGRGA